MSVAQYYDKLTKFYRIFYHAKHIHYGYSEKGIYTLNQATKRFSEKIGECLEPLGTDAHVLDAGCGVGGTSLLLAKKYGCKVTGITVSDYQVNAANQSALEKNLDNLCNFIQDNFQKTNFADQTFTHAFALESSCYANDKKVFLKEMNRILRANGKLVIADCYLHLPENELTPRQAYLYHTFNEGFQLPSLPWRSDMDKWVQEADFKTIENLNITHNVWPTTLYILFAGLISYPVAYILSKLKLVPNELLAHLKTCIVQRAFMREVCSYRLYILQKAN